MTVQWLKTEKSLFLCAIVVSFCITLVELSVQNPINADGILYLHTAKVYLAEGLQAAMESYQWPWLSLLIAEMSKLTQLSLEHTAYLLNAVFQAMIVVAFIRLVKAMKGDRSHQYIAAFVILSCPFFDSIHAQITRDFAYWGLALFAVLALVSFANTLRWRHAISWGVLMSLATLFRIEGAVLLGLAPMVLLWAVQADYWTRVICVLKAYAVVFVLGVLLLLYVLSHPVFVHEQLGRLTELVMQMQQGFILAIQSINESTDKLGKAVLSAESVGYAKTILIGGLLSMLVVSLIKVMSPLYLLIGGYAVAHQLNPATRATKLTMMGLIVINALIIVIFLAQKLFVDKRYLVLLVLLSLLWVPFGVMQLYRNWRARAEGLTGKSWFFPLLCLLLLMAAISGVVRFGHSKAHIVEAGRWLNTHTPVDAKLYSNSVQVLYYADRDKANWQKVRHVSDELTPILNQADLHRQYDYLAIRIKRHEHKDKEKVLAIFNKSPVQVFKNKRGDEVLIFQN